MDAKHIAITAAIALAVVYLFDTTRPKQYQSSYVNPDNKGVA